MPLPVLADQSDKMITARLLLVFVPVVATQITLQPKPLIGFSGQSVEIRCVKPPNATNSLFSLLLNGGSLTFSNSKLTNATLAGTVAIYTYGPLEKQEDNFNFTCDGGAMNIRDSETIRVYYKPEFGGLQSTINADLTNRIVVNFSIDANPPPTSKPLLTKSGSIMGIVDSNITISDTSITFSSIQCNHNGTYSILTGNIVENASATFSIVVSRAPILMPTEFSVPKEKALSGIANHVVACLDDTNRITIICHVPGRSSIQGKIVAGQDFLWQRSDFVDNSLNSGTVEISCSGTILNDTGSSVTFFVTYGALGCGDVVYCYVTIIVVIIGVVLILGIVIVLIVSCYLKCKKKDPGSGSQKLEDKELDEKL